MNEPENAGTTFRMGENRRMYPRRKIERLAYVDFGPDNGGMLIDIGEGGLSFQGVGRVTKGQPLHLRFTLPGAGSRPIEATAELVWSNTSGKGGGLQFIEITESARDQVRQWILGGVATASDSWRRPFGGMRPLAPMDPINPADSNDVGGSAVAPPASTVGLPGALPVPLSEPPAPPPSTSLAAPEAGLAADTLLEAEGGTSSPVSDENVSAENVSAENLSERQNVFERNVFESDLSAHNGAGHSLGEHDPFESAIRETSAHTDDNFDAASDGFDLGLTNDFGNAATEEKHLDAEHAAPAEPVPAAEIWPDLAAEPWAKSAGDFAPATEDPGVADPIPAVRAIPVPAASPSETEAARGADFSQELPGASADGAKTSAFFRNGGGATAANAGDANAGDANAVDANAGVDKPAPGFEPSSVVLNPEFDARTARNHRSSDGIENGESLITSVAVILASAGVAVLGVMIGLRIFAAPAGSGDAAGGSASSLAKEMPAGASPFEVNVVDVKNRRWVLGSAGPAESTGANLARGAQPLRDAGDPGESGGNFVGNSVRSDRENIATTLPPLPIKAPHSAQPLRAASEMMAPSIEGPASEESAPRLPVIAGEEVGPARPLEPLPPARAAAVPGGAAVPSASFPSANRPAAAGPTPGGAVPGGAGATGSSPNGSASAANAPASSGGVPSVPSGPIGFKGPVLISHIEPSYPAVARQQHAEGDVLVRVIIGKNGIPRQMQVVRGDVRLVPAALEVIPQWRYKPALLSGQPTDSQLVVTVSFRLR
jgi:protein TonB